LLRLLRLKMSQKAVTVKMLPDREPEGLAERSESECLSVVCSEKQRLLQKHSSEFEHDRDVRRIIDSEITSYLNYSVKSDNPLQFWKAHEKLFPHLCILARSYLSMSASSVPVEQMFSSCGLLLNVKRSSMAPCRASVVSFIHDNYAQFFPLSRAQAALNTL